MALKKRYLPKVDTALRPPPHLPDARSVRSLGLPLSGEHLRSIRIAMALWRDSRKPKMTWVAWQYLGYALEIGRDYADRTHTPKKSFGLFLKATGFTFINEGLRWALRKCMADLDDINGWYNDLPSHVRNGLNDPINIWEQFQKGDPFHAAKPRKKSVHRQYPSLLEEYQMLLDKLEAIEEHRDELLGLMNELRKDPAFEASYQTILHKRNQK